MYPSTRNYKRMLSVLIHFCQQKLLSIYEEKNAPLVWCHHFPSDANDGYDATKKWAHATSTQTTFASFWVSFSQNFDQLLTLSFATCLNLCLQKDSLKICLLCERLSLCLDQIASDCIGQPVKKMPRKRHFRSVSPSASAQVLSKKVFPDLMSKKLATGKVFLDKRIMMWYYIHQ